MAREPLIVAFGNRTYRIERPWAEIAAPGKVTDVAIDGRGRMAVLLRSDPYTDEASDPVQLFGRDGKGLGSFGANDIADAHKIATDPEGRIWVVDRDAHEILGFDPAGKVFTRIGRRHCPQAPFNHPSDIAFGLDGTIVVADGYANGRVHVFAPDLTHRVSFGETGIGPGEFMTVHGIWLADDGRILVADRENNRVQVFNQTGALLAIWNGFHRPSDIWGDAQGRFYVSDGIPSFTCLAADGSRIGRCRPVLNGAHGICGAEDGSFYLAEGTPSRITRLAPID
ncbi:MAG: peptidase [Methylobacterium sp.]|nr:peptidase [Methylobacterium sp.]MCA3602361.1 peptidase [Methylobacterium sp.]MCA3613921.1 peptidase [Methylobacterium sp.]MCA3642039.1 peptidase [Methylobacterium sp.]